MNELENRIEKDFTSLPEERHKPTLINLIQVSGLNNPEKLQSIQAFRMNELKSAINSLFSTRILSTDVTKQEKIKEEYTKIIFNAPTNIDDKIELCQLFENNQGTIPADTKRFISNWTDTIDNVIPILWNNETFRKIFIPLAELTLKAKEGKGEALTALITENGCVRNTKEAGGDVSVKGLISLEVKGEGGSLDPKTGRGTTYHLFARDQFFGDILETVPDFENQLGLRCGECYLLDGSIKTKKRKKRQPVINQPILWDWKQQTLGLIEHPCVTALNKITQTKAKEILFKMLTGFYPTYDYKEMNKRVDELYISLGTENARTVFFKINFDLYKQAEGWDSLFVIDPKNKRITNISNRDDLGEIVQYISFTPCLYRSGSLEQRADGYVILRIKKGIKHSKGNTSLLGF